MCALVASCGTSRELPVAVCGDDFAAAGEECDGADLSGHTCATLEMGSGELECDDECVFDTRGCSSVVVATCGDGVAEGAEACDGVDLLGASCTALGYSGGGTLVCLGTCDGFDTSECTGTGPVCGDGTINQTSEQCDGADIGATCAEVGYAGGTLGCRADCRFDDGDCTGPPAVCGDDVVQGAEVCDGTRLAGATCVSLGQGTGTLGCAADCQSFDTTGCSGGGPVCGDGTREGTEVCDGADLSNETCASQGKGTGTLTCRSNCTGFDVAGCAWCGNARIDAGETCDGSALAGQTCSLQVPGSVGPLACSTDCRSYDTSACGVSCGNGAIDAANGEVCDGSNVGGRSCTDLGYRPPGSVGCLPTCLAFDVSGCSPPGSCGAPGPLGSKQCDGTNLGGEDCLSLGYTGGSLSCVSCTFDVSGCTP